jgi:hypothetical protein
LDEQFVESRIDKGVPACQWGLVHKDIHSHCGYLEKGLTIRDLAFWSWLDGRQRQGLQDALSDHACN